MSETPRTDALEYTLEYEKHVVDADFARWLETELANKDRLLERMQQALREILKIQRTVDLNLFDIEQVHAIAEAALAVTQSNTPKE